MAHKIRIKPRPHLNRDGSASKSKLDYVVICKCRGKICAQEVFTSKKAAEDAKNAHWDTLAYYRKNGRADRPVFASRKQRPKIHIRVSVDTSAFTSALDEIRGENAA